MIGSRLGDDCSHWVVAWCMQSRDDNVMTSNAAQGIDIVIDARLWQRFVLLVQHLQCIDLFYLQGMDPSDCIILVVRLPIRIYLPIDFVSVTLAPEIGMLNVEEK